MPQITKKCQDCPVLNVVVYQDKAEVKRSIQVDLTEAGENELIISAVVNTIDRNSVR